MAGPKKSPKMTKEGYAGKCPSAFGSHKAMISEEWTQKLPQDSPLVVLEGDDGFYVTEWSRLDSGISDPNRYASPEFRVECLRQALPGVQVTKQEEKVLLKT